MHAFFLDRVSSICCDHCRIVYGFVFVVFLSFMLFFLSSSSSRLLFPPLVNLLIAYFSKQFDALRVLRLLFHSFVLLSCQFFFGFINFRLFRAFFNFDCICIRPVSPNAFPFISHLWLWCHTYIHGNRLCSKSKADNFSKCVPFFCCCLIIMFYVSFFRLLSFAPFCSQLDRSYIHSVIVDYFGFGHYELLALLSRLCLMTSDAPHNVCDRTMSTTMMMTTTTTKTTTSQHTNRGKCIYIW